MSQAPDRSSDVQRAFEALTPAPETDTDEGRRANTYAVVRSLNRLDGGEWGVLVKDDQGGKIPADIIVWKSSMEHFDIQTGGVGRPTWQPKGIVTNPAWRWSAVAGEAAPVPVPPHQPPVEPPHPQPIPDPPSEGFDLVAALARIEAALAKPAPVYKGRIFGVTVTLRPE